MKRTGLTVNQMCAAAVIVGWCGAEIREILKSHPEPCFIRESVSIFLEMAGTSVTEFETEPPRGLPLPL